MRAPVRVPCRLRAASAASCRAPAACAAAATRAAARTGRPRSCCVAALTPCRGTACARAHRRRRRERDRRDRCTSRSDARAPRARRFACTHARASSAHARLLRWPVRARDARPHARRIRARAQHPLVVVRLEHEDLDVAQRVAHARRSRARDRARRPRARRSRVASRRTPTGSRASCGVRTVRHAHAERASSVAAGANVRTVGAAASSGAARRPCPSLACSVHPQRRAAAAAPRRDRVCSCVTMHALDRLRARCRSARSRAASSRAEKPASTSTRVSPSRSARRCRGSRSRAPRPSLPRSTARACAARSCRARRAPPSVDVPPRHHALGDLEKLIDVVDAIRAGLAPRERRHDLRRHRRCRTRSRRRRSRTPSSGAVPIAGLRVVAEQRPEELHPRVAHPVRRPQRDGAVRVLQVARRPCPRRGSPSGRGTSARRSRRAPCSRGRGRPWC